MSARVFFFGKWGVPGHYLYTPEGQTLWSVAAVPARRSSIPWSDGELDASDAKTDMLPRDRTQPQGVWRLSRRRDTAGSMWTALGCWDRTGDHRGNSKSIFIAEGDHDEAAMRDLAAQHFPAVWQRITGSERP